MGSRWTVWRSRKIGDEAHSLMARMKKHGIFRPAEENSLDHYFRDDSLGTGPL